MQDSPLEVTITGAGLTGTDIDRAARRLGIFERYGLDPAGEIVGRPPRYYIGMDDYTGQLVNDAELDAEIQRIEDEKLGKQRARWTTTPREIIREGPSPLVLSTTPDVAYTPRGSGVCPIPYATCARPTSPQNFANTVRATNQRIMLLRSRELITHGAEQGVALGVVPGTINGPVDPLQHSTNVRAEGSYIIRDQDAVWMNDFNNLGVIQMDGDRSLVKPANSPDIPGDGDDDEGFFDGLWDGAKDAWQATKDAASSAAQAIADFDREHGRVLTRGVGVVQAVGGAAEAIGGGALATGGAVATPTGVGTVPGIGAMALGGALWINGWDNAWTGLQTAWTGEFQHTMTAQAAGAAAEALGADPATAQSIRDGTDLASGALSIGGGIAAGARTGARETVEAGMRESAETASREIDEVAEATAEQTGRVTRSRWVARDVHGRRVYQADDLFDPHAIDEDGLTNIERMKEGRAPIGRDGEEVNLHHMIQEEPGPLAEVSGSMHRESSKTLHMYRNQWDKTWVGPDGVRRPYHSAPPSLDRRAFDAYRKKYWKTRADDF